MTLNIYSSVDTYDLEGSEPIKVNKAGHVSHLTENGLIEERYPLVGKVGSSDDLAEETNRIVRLKHLTALYHSQGERTVPVWLREQANDDIYTRQALIYDIQITWFAQRGKTRLLTDGTVFYGELVIIRDAEWESTVEQSQSESSVSLIGGAFELASYYYKGMTGARIDSLLIKDPEIDTTDTEIYEAWVGIREKGPGFSSFVPLQECENGTNGTDTTNNSQTYFNDGSAKRCTFATNPGMIDRVTFKLSDFAASNYHHFFGEFLILLGYQHNLSAGTGAMIAQLTGENVVSGPATTLPQVSTQRSRIVELGYVRLPGQNLREKYADITISNLGFGIAAERTAGTEYLYLDFIILMPAQRILKMTPTYYQLTDGGRLYFHQHPDRSMAAYQTQSGVTTFQAFMKFEAQGFRLPADEAMLIFAANTFATHTDPAVLDADIDVTWRQTFEKYHTA